MPIDLYHCAWGRIIINNQNSGVRNLLEQERNQIFNTFSFVIGRKHDNLFTMTTNAEKAV